MTRAHAVNVFWSGLEAGASGLLSFATAFIVARLIGPAEFGIGAAAVAVHVLLWITVNALFADPLVQRSAVDAGVFSSAFAASIAVGCAAAMLQAALGAPLAWSLGDDRPVAMSLLLALPLPLVGAAGPVQGLLTRGRDYRALAWRTLLGQGGGTAAGVVCALAGAGAWALVLQQFVTSAVGATTLLLHCPIRPTGAISRERLREMLAIGLPLTASTLVQHGRYRLFALLIGGIAGAAPLGQLHMAFRLIDAVRDLAFTAQWRLMLPLLSERQGDLPGLRARLDRCLTWSSLAAFPLCAAMAVTIEPVMVRLLGPVWQPAGQASLPLVALTAWLFLAFPAGVAMVARGETQYMLIANLAAAIAVVGGVLVVRPATPLQAALLWIGAQLVVSPYIVRTNARLLHTHLLRPFRAGVPMLVAATIATVVAIGLPPLIGGPAQAAWLPVLRLLIVVAVCAPVALAIVAPVRLDRWRLVMARSPRPEPNGEA
jgi:O-antigen/teichoic acid export membrane protein